MNSDQMTLLTAFDANLRCPPPPLLPCVMVVMNVVVMVEGDSDDVGDNVGGW
jgi:hypothetical protein